MVDNLFRVGTEAKYIRHTSLKKEIDHRKTVIVSVTDRGEETKQIESEMEKHVRFSGGSRSEQGGGKINRIASLPAISTVTMMR
jgi:hypothetical protein